ncbi:PRKC apoptosis WT1 regulator protein [Liparis tanakae]|uniref:PRKC apoptosis WT1 regulator protein n=1 Tax=Liparis tanakae TaxID=230148 RepID=A0A4Z2FJX9_9TELE|nr:PRKC apoptosis WT1 regulator protein [Liparis tanakae]
MATGGFKPNATTDFLEEWKAKREKMRIKMLGDIAAATGAPLGASNPNNHPGNRHPELPNNGSPDRSASAGNCFLPPSAAASSSSSSSYAVARSSSGTALKRPEEETPPHPHPHHHPPPALPASPTAVTPPGSSPKKAASQTEPAPCDSPDSGPMACNDSDKGSPSPGKAKEKNSSGPSAKKGKGQIEKRKLREKRRSTGVVSIPSSEGSRVSTSLLGDEVLGSGGQAMPRDGW